MPQLTRLGDHEAKRTARRVPYRLLDSVEQVGDPASGNLLIQGDNSKPSPRPKRVLRRAAHVGYQRPPR